MQELQQQTNEPIRMDLTGCYSRVNGPSSPVDLKSSQQKNSQLKESHSALVKILESAPIQRLDKEIILVGGSDGSGSPSGTETNITPNTDNRHHHYRKRNKHLVDTNNCDNHDKSSEDESNTKVEMICPWKKTRIAREWRQKNKEMQEARERQEDKNKFMDLDDEDDDNNDSSCDCNDIWRRSSSDSIESIQNDSGCDSDCRENITELCKKFDENLSEQDVCIVYLNTHQLTTNHLNLMPLCCLLDLINLQI